MPVATLFSTSLLTLLYLWLTRQVVRRRRDYRTPYGYSEQHPDLERAVRAHANFQEYTPLFLILLYLLESSAPDVRWLCYLLGALFFLGRVAHAASLLRVEAERLKKGERLAVAFRLRFFAMTQTFTALSVPALLLLLQAALQLSM